jgi:23S rRNA (uracil1939-C5)-methyltransferase
MARRKPLPAAPVELLIESLAHDGRGVGRYEGKAVFVSGALPGETVRAKIRQRKRRFDVAQLEQVITASPDRVAAKCRHFDQCGGCSLQHMSPVAQLTSKQHVLAENLRRIGHVQPRSWLEPLQADIWAYRGKARLGVRYVAKKGRVLVGFREQHSSLIADTTCCEILIPALGQRLQLIADSLNELSIREVIPQIEIAAGDNQLCLTFRVLQEPGAEDKERLMRLAKTLACDILLQPAGPESIYSLTGRPAALSYTLPDWNLTFEFSVGDFTQVNSSLNRKMVSQAMQFLAPERDETVLDLFCGVGNFSLPIATRVNQLVGIEGDADMVGRAYHNAKLNNLSNVEFHTADLFQPDGDENWRKRRYDKVLLDPPRSGAEAVARWLPQNAPATIVYVSCNPSTLARDAAILVNSGAYVLDKAGVMDMFPHTAHIEAMAVFQRTAKP